MILRGPSLLLFYFIFNVLFFFSAEMTTKFNQDMYAKMRAKKNKPLFALGKRVVRVMDHGSPAIPATIVIRPMRVAFPTTSVEEIMPRMADKGKEKASS